MFNIRLAGGHLYGKQLFTWLSLVVSLMASFVLSLFPLDVLDSQFLRDFLPTLVKTKAFKRLINEQHRLDIKQMKSQRKYRIGTGKFTLGKLSIVFVKSRFGEKFHCH